DLRYRPFRRLRIRARIGGRDRHLGRRHVRVRLDAEVEDGQRPGQCDQDRDDPGENGPVDEELWHGAAPQSSGPAPASPPPPAWAVVPAGTEGTAMAPSRTFCRPDVMTRSPASSPAVMSTLPSRLESTVTSRRVTVPSGSSSQT